MAMLFVYNPGAELFERLIHARAKSWMGNTHYSCKNGEGGRAFAMLRAHASFQVRALLWAGCMKGRCGNCAGFAVRRVGNLRVRLGVCMQECSVGSAYRPPCCASRVVFLMSIGVLASLPGGGAGGGSHRPPERMRDLWGGAGAGMGLVRGAACAKAPLASKRCGV